MSSSLDALNLEGAKSEELRSVIACVMDATASDGGPRYTRRVISALTRILVCRSYAKPTLELSHFLAAISDTSGRFEHILWGVDRATPSAFRSFIEDIDWDPARAKLSRQGLIHVTQGAEFQVSCSRMPILTALLEFLISALGYSIVDELTIPIRCERSDDKVIGEVANSLQRALYKYLKEHLPPAHRQKRERHFLGFVDDRAGNRGGADAITDEIVIDYWQAYAAEPGLDNKTYRSVYDMAERMIIALDAAIERVRGDHALSIGSDREVGEVDPEDIENMIALCDSEETPLVRILEGDGGAVKFITATEADVLGALPMKNSVERRIPLSIVRSAVQGAVQLKLSSMLRRHASVAGGDSRTEPQSYTEYLQGLQSIASVIDRILLASLWLLHAGKHPVAVSVALKIAPDINWGSLVKDSDKDKPEDENTVSIDIHRAMRQFFDATPDKRGDEVQALLSEARQAFRGVNRKGFKNPCTPDVIAEIADGVEDVIALNVAIRGYTDRIVGSIDWEAVERSDARVFGKMFEILYGKNK